MIEWCKNIKSDWRLFFASFFFNYFPSDLAKKNFQIKKVKWIYGYLDNYVIFCKQNKVVWTEKDYQKTSWLTKMRIMNQHHTNITLGHRYFSSDSIRLYYWNQQFVTNTIPWILSLCFNWKRTGLRVNSSRKIFSK